MRGPHGRTRYAAALALTAGTLLGGVAWGFYRPGTDTVFADADNPALVTQGRHIYAAHCTSCHGRALQGQPLWQMQDAQTHRRAPALDRFGPAWLQSDSVLIGIVTNGGEIVPPDTKSAMPGFGATLGKPDILAVTAFIKARWPIGLRVAQALLNPGSKGMPRQAAMSKWQFPPNCTPPTR